MKFRILIVAALLACAAVAQNPSHRLGRLLSCDSVTIKETGKDPYTLFGNPRVRELLRYVQIQTEAVRGPSGGKLMYKLSFFDGADKKPTDVLWVRYGGIWGFDKERFPYGKDDRLIPWLVKAKG